MTTSSTSNFHGSTPTAVVATQTAADRLCLRLRRWCGVHLDSSKRYLLDNRLRNLMIELGVEDYDQLLAMAEKAGGTPIRDRIVDALTTHETLFFRDHSPFQALETVVVPEIRESTKFGKPRLRVWSAACSTGQEPYSIAIKLAECLPDINNWNISILGTDVSSGTVARASAATYQEHEIQRGTSKRQRDAFFRPSGDNWQLVDSIRSMVTIRVTDLSAQTLPTGPFDLIFCRNVLIYFQPEDANRILRNVAKRLTPNGRLIVGSGEVLRDIEDFLVTDSVGQATCYRLKE
ncbi:MAG: protein-glutamate O-methyltransferase CheR [Rubripirellula sp.]